jgi:hypothetical protein
MSIGNQFYSTAVILIIYWAIGYLAFNAGILIHVLLVIAVFAIIDRLIQTLKERTFSMSEHTPEYPSNL